MSAAMTRALLLLFALLPSLAAPAQQSHVRVEPDRLQGSRQPDDQTRMAVVRDYLEAWQSLRAALEQNRAELLDHDFVGAAKDKLSGTIRDQVTLGISTRYVDQSHDVQIVFYSPEGLSIQLIDTMQYEVEVVDHGKVQAKQHATTRSIVVMTPSEVRWRVRILQEQPE
jgi:hypothetical protein